MSSSRAKGLNNLSSQLIKWLHSTKRRISKAVTVRATKAYRDNRRIAPFTHSFGARLDCVIFKPRHAPVALAPKKVLLAPNDTEAGWSGGGS